MTVKQLVELLQTFPQDVEVLMTRCSDYELITEGDISLIQGLARYGQAWITRPHPRMTDTDQTRLKSYVHFAGN